MVQFGGQGGQGVAREKDDRLDRLDRLTRIGNAWHGRRAGADGGQGAHGVAREKVERLDRLERLTPVGNGWHLQVPSLARAAADPWVSPRTPACDRPLRYTRPYTAYRFSKRARNRLLSCLANSASLTS